jgi:uncharacterized protein DUF4170
LPSRQSEGTAVSRETVPAKAQAIVDNAHMRHLIVHPHRLLEPDAHAPTR